MVVNVDFYKEIDGRWYADLPEWTGEKAELEMIAGADTLLEYIAEGEDKVNLYLSDEKNYATINILELVEASGEVDAGGSYILNKLNQIEVNLSVWLCDVTKFVFGNFPEKIYFNKNERKTNL